MKILFTALLGIGLFCVHVSPATAQLTAKNTPAPVSKAVATPSPSLTASASATPSTPAVMQIACLDASGNPTVPNTCNAILPNCSDIKTTYEGQVKNFLSWKIWGYYQGKNIDLNASTLNATNPTYAGPALAYPICSVVGHTMQFTGARPVPNRNFGLCDKSRATQANAYAAAGIEYATQTIGGKNSCGARPNALTGKGGMEVVLQFQSGAGNLWDSWLIGAYPWLIRRYASDVLTQIKPDLSNMGDVLTDASAIADWNSLNTTMGGYFSSISADAKTACSTTSASPAPGVSSSSTATATSNSIVAKCTNGTMSLTDPANRLCTLVKAQTTLNSGALPNMLVKEIMARVQTNYDSLFDNLMTFKSGPASTLWSKCKDTGSLFRAGAKKKAMTASCLFDGANFYAYTADGTPAQENDCTGSSSHVADDGYVFRVSDGSVSSIGDNIGSDKTLLFGFGGLVEYIIRHNICQQNSYSDASVCDSINIPDKPGGVQ